MQYMAIIDVEELIFLGGERRCWVDIAWQNFRCRERVLLDQPVTYEIVSYRKGLTEIMQRLRQEFLLALQTTRPIKYLQRILEVLSSSLIGFGKQLFKIKTIIAFSCSEAISEIVASCLIWFSLYINVFSKIKAK